MKIEVNGRAVDAHDGETLLATAPARGHRHSHPLSFRRPSPERGLPHVRRRGRGAARPRPELRLPGEQTGSRCRPTRRAPSMRAARSSNCCSPITPTTACTARATATATSRRWPGNWASGAAATSAGARRRGSTWPARRSRAIPPSASSAASASACARKSRQSGAIDFIGRGSQAHVGPAFDEGLNISSCINCGQCVAVCPTGALAEHSAVESVVSALADPKAFVVVQHAPSVSVSLAEEFGAKPGADVDGALVACLRRLGLQAGLRHLLHCGPHDHGGGVRAGASARRAAARSR